MRPLTDCACLAPSPSSPCLPCCVQDVGLIFLSAMASDVVWECGRAGVTDGDTVGTAMMTLTLATAVVGLLIILTGEL